MMYQTLYECPCCKAQHNDIDSAIDCCNDVIAFVFTCPTCHQDHPSKQEAKVCCDEIEKNRHYKEELEKAGQLRLI